MGEKMEEVRKLRAELSDKWQKYIDDGIVLSEEDKRRILKENNEKLKPVAREATREWLIERGIIKDPKTLDEYLEGRPVTVKESLDIRFANSCKWEVFFENGGIMTTDIVKEMKDDNKKVGEICRLAYLEEYKNQQYQRT